MYWTASTFATRSWATTKSSIARTSAAVVQGVKGNHDGRISIPWRRSNLDRRAGVRSSVTLVQDAQRRVVDRLECRHHEQAAGLRQVRPQLLVGEDVLDLDRAVERQVGKGGVHGTDHSHRVPRAVQEIRIRERHMPRPHRLQLGDVGHDDVLGHDPKATVVHDGERTVPAAVRAPWLASTAPRAALHHRGPGAGRSSGGSRSCARVRKLLRPRCTTVLARGTSRAAGAVAGSSAGTARCGRAGRGDKRRLVLACDDLVRDPGGYRRSRGRG